MPPPPYFRFLRPMMSLRRRKSGYRYIKVFGERNSGTNFLNELVSRNTDDVEVLDHGNNDLCAEELKRFPPEHHLMVDERMRDYVRLQEFSQNFGFKHSMVSEAILQRSDRYPETLFIFVSRNPFYFLKALYRRPYSLVPRPTPETPFDDFLKQPLLLHEREFADYPVARSPIHLWSLKVASLVKTSRAISNSIFIRYEDLVEQPPDFLASLAEKQISIRETVDIPQRSTKGDQATFQDYQRKSREYDPRSDYTEGQIDYVLSKIDTDLCEQLGYLPLQ